MDKNKVKVVIVCEDLQQAVFMRRFLSKRGYERRNFRVEKCRPGKGAADVWVQNKYVDQLREHRVRHVNIILIVMIDGDKFTVDERLRQLNDACERGNVPKRGEKEKVAIFVPRRNIETWIHYLQGEAVDENISYPRLERERDCKDAVVELIRMCDQNQLRTPAPPSLESACREYNARLKAS